MKAPRFWYPAPGQLYLTPLAWLLWPLSLGFRLGTALRRACARKPYRPRIPLICIGNVVAGGAGKTPTALALARLLQERGQKPVFVTRGYGGRLGSKGQGVTRVDPGRHISDEVGDEALLLASFAPTWVSRDRAAAARQAESHGTIMIMDDGFQNPHIVPTVSLVVFDGEAGIGNGFIIPAGPLRESFATALQRAAAVVIVGTRDRQGIAARSKIPAFRARLRPSLPKGFSRAGRFLAFAGIGIPEKFYATARTLGLDLVETRDFPDHHPYTQADIDDLRRRAKILGAKLLTTEKDAIRLPPVFRAEVKILPVRLIFDDERAEEELARLCIIT